MVRHAWYAKAAAGLLKIAGRTRSHSWSNACPPGTDRGGDQDLETTRWNALSSTSSTPLATSAGGSMSQCVTPPLEPWPTTRAARKPGEAARRAERTKHERYPGEALTAFAVELPGRLGAEAREWLKQQVRQLPSDTWTQELNRAYKVLSCSLQTWMARQLRASSGLK